MKRFTLLLILILAMSFSSGAVESINDTSTGFIQIHEFNTTYNITGVVLYSESCEIISVNTPSSFIIPDNTTYITTTTLLNSTFSLYDVTLSPSFFQERGYYQIYIYCHNGLPSEEKIFVRTIYVTENGNDYNDFTITALISLLVFFCFLFFGLFNIKKNINFEQWNSKIIKNYETRNFIKLILGGMAYNIMKNSYVLYYLIGLPIISLLTELVLTFNIESLIMVMPVLSFIYTFGIILLGVLFFSNVQEWIMDFFKQISDFKWGSKTE